MVLGRITVQSALGESLRAEIDISDLGTDEASSLRVGVAGADVFRAAGLEYSASASGLDVRLQRRPDGKPYLRLSSNRAISEPFMDLVLEARWASGRVTRDYTMLFDPPNLRNSSAALASSMPVAASALPSSQGTPAPYSRPVARAVQEAPRPQAINTPPAENTSGARQTTVRPGDNASRIAAQNKPVDVSLDQMLVALLRGNPEAFVGGNINLIKSGAVVAIPDAQAAKVLSSGDAKQALIAQSQDFNTLRRKLADGVPATPLDHADRQAGGKVQTRVDDRTQTSASPDRLTLSKGTDQGMPSGEQSARDAANRTADQSKNGSALKNPQSAMPGTGGTAPGLSVAGPSGSPAVGGAPAITAIPALNSSSAAEAAISALASSSAVQSMPNALPTAPLPSVSAPASVVPTPIQQAAQAAPLAPSGPDPITWILDNPLLLGGATVLALLTGLGFAYRRKKAASSAVDSSFLDSRLQPDSFFDASGGQRVDTNASNAKKSSSLAYSPSQLDAAGDVDPVAEADVYLAYGRDQQAEEILKEALSTYPARLAIHSKLLEIYAKRRDNKAFENVALTAFKLTRGQGDEWSYISQLGRELEPSNSMYQSNASFSVSLPGKKNSDPVPLSNTIPQALTGLSPALTTVQASNLDLDLDLDFGSFPASSASIAPVLMTGSATADSGSKAEAVPDMAIPSTLLDLDLSLDDAAAAADHQDLSIKLPSSEMDHIANGMDFTPEPFVASKATIAPTAPASHTGMLEFDLDSLSLDLDPATKLPAEALTGQEKDPLEIKFLLAEEFRILGDSEGAKSLADEVVAHAKGPLKFKAQAFLNTLS